MIPLTTVEPAVSCAECAEPLHGQAPCWAHAYNRADVASKAGDDAEATRLRIVSIRAHARFHAEERSK